MTFNLLIACMNEKDTSIIERSNVQSDAVVVNQCDKNCVEEFDFVNKKGVKCHVKFINTTERGLSRSRNMAIHHAWGDVCQICDDDEFIDDDAESKILEAYGLHRSAGVITFSLVREDCNKKYPTKGYKINFIHALKTNSLQITFNRNIINGANISFDEKMGSGTGNGGGEENKFMLDCYRAGIEMHYLPVNIATVKPSVSQWQFGYTAKWIENMGWSSRRSMGPVVGLIYGFYFVLTHRSRYSEQNVTMFNAGRSMLRGYFSKRD